MGFLFHHARAGGKRPARLALAWSGISSASIDAYGHIPNGNRTYYLSRSQPPFFAAMVELIADEAGDPAERSMPNSCRALGEEYDFWMEGADALEPGSAHRRVVRLKDGTLLNRYWDDRDIPREESYREDVTRRRRPAARRRRSIANLRAAAESGWDFSSRWLADGKTLATIRTTDLVPVDLNSLHGPARDDACQGICDSSQAGEEPQSSAPVPRCAACGAALSVESRQRRLHRLSLA